MRRVRRLLRSKCWTIAVVWHLSGYDRRPLRYAGCLPQPQGVGNNRYGAKLIESTAIIGDNRRPVSGYKTPAATGDAQRARSAKRRFSDTLRTAATESSRARAIERKSPFTRVKWALLIATSVPVPIAIPTSAWQTQARRFLTKLPTAAEVNLH